ncbi:MAG: LysM peptidoglycan-binding domain-containing protein [Anaerolineales bacterium]|nr:LysM peptidoglycan-binding domain-containing protein [Anaerolineales bacterium]
MKKIIYPFVLTAIISLALSSCGLFPSSSDDSLIIPAEAQATPSIADLVKIELTAQVDTSIPYNTVGQIIKFKYFVKAVQNGSSNIAPNLTITGAAATCPAINTVGNLDDRLDQGETIECTADHPITQADLDSGAVTKIATATIYGVNSNQVNTTVPTVPAKALTLTKTASPTAYDRAGQIITFQYVIKNSGSSQLGPDQFKVTDTGITTPINCGDPTLTLAPNATVTCSANYTVTQADLGVATVTTTATASGGGAGPSQPATATITKGTTSSNLTPGATISHLVVEGEWLWQIARCYGADPAKTVAANPQLANPAQIKAGITVTVPNIGSNGKIYAPQPCVGKHLVQSGDTWSSIAAKYGADPTIMQMANSNTLTVGKEVKVPFYTAGINPQPQPSNTLSLTVTATPTSYGQVGQVITINYVIKNNGTTTLGPTPPFTVSDPLVSATAFNCGPANTTLAPAATISCSVTHTITQTDMGFASISIRATASGGGAGTSPVAEAVILRSAAALTLTTTANSPTYSQVGQVITFTYVIKNSGSATVGPAQFTISDPLINPTPFSCGVPDATIAPNATITCAANYTVTQADLGFVSVTSNATASGGGATPSQPFQLSIIKQ